MLRRRSPEKSTSSAVGGRVAFGSRAPPEAVPRTPEAVAGTTGVDAAWAGARGARAGSIFPAKTWVMKARAQTAADFEVGMLIACFGSCTRCYGCSIMDNLGYCTKC